MTLVSGTMWPGFTTNPPALEPASRGKSVLSPPPLTTSHFVQRGTPTHPSITNRQLLLPDPTPRHDSLQVTLPKESESPCCTDFKPLRTPAHRSHFMGGRIDAID